MAVVVINKLPCFLSLPYCKLFLSRQQHQLEDYGLGCRIHEHPSQKTCRTRACSIKSSKRGSRKVKSNAELCNDLRDFVSAAGLPEGYVPSMKELSDHGRTDLANIVRRRGYKIIRDLLSNSPKKDLDGSDVQQSLTEGQDAAKNRDTQTGQNEKVDGIKGEVDDIKGDGLLSSEVSITGSLSCPTDIDNSDSHSCISVDVPVHFSLEEKALYNAQVQHEDVESMAEDSSLSGATYNTEQQDEKVKLVDDNSLSTPFCNLEPHDNGALVENTSLSNEVFISDTHHDSSNMCPNLNSDDNVSKHVDTSTSFPSKDEVTFNAEDQQEKVKNMINDIPLSAGASSTEYHVNNVPGINFIDHGSMHTDLIFNSSLEEKVANFIRNGDLDVIEYDVYDISKLERSADIQSKNLSECSFGHTVDGSNAALTLNGSLSTSKPVPHVTANHPVRNDLLSGDTLVNGDSDKDLDIETSKQQNHVEINNLHFMLRQKELELSGLKEQIKKEKLALSALQSRAETEISKAQKLISEKDAELLAAEESLSGLVEVKIQYCGDGEIVEMGGSFNGWHHQVKMDPQQFPSIMDSVGSRKSRLWATTLWLYPGVYEIKFIVDGHWRIDPQRESVTRGGITNNILRVGS